MAESINSNIVLELVDKLSIQELRNLGKEGIITIINMYRFDGVQVNEFIFAKNIKIFGGINGYINDFLSYDTITKIRNISDKTSKISARNGAISILNKFLDNTEITDENSKKVNLSILELNQII